VVNLALIAFLVERDRIESDTGRALYQLLSVRRREVPPGSLVILRHLPTTLFKNGIGVREMVRFALADPRADGVADFELARARRTTPPGATDAVFEVDLEQRPLQLRPRS
jgi:hypothetical protein